MTERDDSLHVVFGATGAIGSAVVTELVRAGRDVRAVSRTPSTTCLTSPADCWFSLTGEGDEVRTRLKQHARTHSPNTKAQRSWTPPFC
jgi:nucleoside-diphosphate-sugar epimerase